MVVEQAIKKRARVELREEVLTLTTLCLDYLAAHVRRLESLEGMPQELTQRLFDVAFERLEAQRPVDFFPALQVFVRTPGLVPSLRALYGRDAHGNGRYGVYLSLIKRIWYANEPLQCLALPKTHNMMQQLALEFNEGPRELLTPSRQLTEACLETMAANAWCPGLQVLHVYGEDTALPEFSVSHDLLARTLGSRCSSLRVLKFERCGSLCMNDDFIEALARTAPLEELWVSGCWRLTDDAVYAITASLSGTLKKLGFGRIPNISNVAYADTANLTRLEHLELDEPVGRSSSQQSDFDLIVPRILNGCTRLQCISVAGRTMSQTSRSLLEDKRRQGMQVKM